MAEQITVPTERKLHDAVRFIRRSFHQRPTLDDIGQAVGLSSFHLHRVFTRRFGESPFQMVARLQVEHAKALLLRGVPAKEVAGRCGYATQSHMTSRFRMATGTTPARWLRGAGGLPAKRSRTGAMLRPA